jgi:ribosomal protein S14
MANYEQRLTGFAGGKRLLRLARPLRDRADASCDACGSPRPRTLYALKDLNSNRHYFVGDNCLRELAKRGAILRRYGRESGREEYETEMQLRGKESHDVKDSSSVE